MNTWECLNHFVLYYNHLFHVKFYFFISFCFFFGFKIFGNEIYFSKNIAITSIKNSTQKIIKRYKNVIFTHVSPSVTLNFKSIGEVDCLKGIISDFVFFLLDRIGILILYIPYPLCKCM